MNTYKLTATALKNGKTLYQVINENGEVISKRTSTRKYVACTIDGSIYFGRLDLIGKGDHGTALANIQDYKFNTTIERYEQIKKERIHEITLSCRVEYNTYVAFVSVERRNAPINDWQINRIRESYGGEEAAAAAKTQQDYKRLSCEPKWHIDSFLQRLGTFDDWKERREKRLVELEPAMQVAYLAN